MEINSREIWSEIIIKETIREKGYSRLMAKIYDGKVNIEIEIAVET